MSFRDGPSGAGPEPMNTGQAIDFSSPCSWVPGSRAMPAPRNDDVHAVWEIEKRLAQEAVRPVIFHPRGATCRQPWVKGLAIMVNSI